MERVQLPVGCEPHAGRPRAVRGMPPVPWGPTVVVAYACGSFLGVNYLIPGRLPAEAELYVVQPAIWGFLAVISVVLLFRTRDAPKVTHSLLALAVLGAAFQVAWLVGAGTAFGFGYSPYSREPVDMAQNGLYVATLLAGIEFSRAYLIAASGHRRPLAALSLVSLFFALLLVPADTYSLLQEPESGFEAAGGTFLPAMSYSVAASYLAARGGPMPAIIFRGSIATFNWFSPILPDLEWTTAAFIETVGPLITVLVVRSLESDDEPTVESPVTQDLSASWIIPSIVLVALLWFNTGMLGVQPAVVSGVSMEPTMEVGDLALTRPADVDSLEVGDIVRFDRGGIPVLHRLVEVEDTPRGRVFVTQGDSNSTPDDPILGEQITGRVVLVIPKLGWVPIAFGKLLYQFQ